MLRLWKTAGQEYGRGKQQSIKICALYKEAKWVKDKNIDNNQIIFRFCVPIKAGWKTKISWSKNLSEYII